ncbi:MAG: hypothetical protein C0518_02010 [Opitutus sp.]|nr:hypothetical protein [Opitutus sp.]
MSSLPRPVDPSRILQDIIELLNALPAGGNLNTFLLPGSCFEAPLPPNDPTNPYYVDLHTSTGNATEFRLEFTNLTPHQLSRILRHAKVDADPQGNARLTLPRV